MAADLFKSVVSSSGLELVTGVLTKTSPPGPTFHSTLDSILSTAASSLTRGDLIELTSAAAVGKTQFLYFLCMTTILPFELAVSLASTGDDAPILLGGRGKSVVVCDCDNRWDMLRLADHLEHYIQKRISLTPDIDASDIPPETIPEAVQSALRRLHLFRPTNTLSLAATLQSLPAYHRTKMKDEEISMLMIDSMTAFYWTDRWELERSKASWESHPMRHVAKALTVLRRDYGIVVWMTTQNLFPHRSDTSTSMQHRGYIPEPTHQITLTKMPTPPFPPSIKLAQARADVQRKEAVKEGRVEGMVKSKGITFDYGIEPHGLLVE
ncbi:hypothetical protein CALCODRAFT_487086 [Calocera cornea HHB12733]|uniref:DNA recombination and repair protein Rad51-like C-terminal domain-containing protein n=1 Tax=Calocera cornea HHB12733 TaxID=1353952 RepID=A0A165DCL8_9BASI|nr:hypothetical protein CALCODRAFT_487086 [Calocera cornea HHB12733]